MAGLCGVSKGIDKSYDATVDWARLIQIGKVNTTKSTNSLVLQTGDTVDSYKYLRMSIENSHVGALGLDNVSIADQDSAATTIDTIKAVINYF